MPQAPAVCPAPSCDPILLIGKISSTKTCINCLEHHRSTYLLSLPRVQAAFRDHIREGERILYLASMGLLKHKRVRNTLAAEPTPRPSEDSEPAAPSDSVVTARQGVQEEVHGSDHDEGKGRTVEDRQKPIIDDAEHVKRKTSHRKAKRSLSTNVQVDRRTNSSYGMMDKASTSEQRSERSARSSTNKKHGDRNDGWFRRKAPGASDPQSAAAELDPSSRDSEPFLRHIRNRKTRGKKPLYCLGDPRFMPISDVDKAFPGQRLSEVQARDPETAAAVRAARAECALGPKQGGLGKAFHKSRKIQPTLEPRRHAGHSGDKTGPVTAPPNIEKSKGGERKNSTGDRPRSAPPIGKRGLVMNDCGHPRRAEFLGQNRGDRHRSGRVRSLPSRDSATESASSARTSDTQTSEVTDTTGGSSLGSSSATSRGESRGRCCSRKRVESLLVELESLRRRVDLAEGRIRKVRHAGPRRRPHTAGCHRSSPHGRSGKEKWRSMAAGGLTTNVTSAKSPAGSSARRDRGCVVDPVIVTHSASAFLDEL